MSLVTLHTIASGDLIRKWRRAVVNKTGLKKGDPFLEALLVFLKERGWTGSARHLVEAFPYLPEHLLLADVRDTLARLKIKTIPVEGKLKKLSPRLFPCLFVDYKGNPFVVSVEEGTIMLFDGRTGETEPVTRRARHKGWFFIESNEEDTATEKGGKAKELVRHVFSLFRPQISQVMLLTFFINILSLVVPLSIMMIYDQVIAKGSASALVYVASGVLLAVTFEIFLRTLRAKAQAYVGARLDYILGCQVFEKILHLPPMFTERAPVGGQVTRLREFESLREAFSGSLAAIAMDLPFTVLFLAVIATIGGGLFLIPVVLAIVYLIIGMMVAPEVEARTKNAGKARSERYAFVTETFWWLRSIKQRNCEDTWETRFRSLSAEASWANLMQRRHQSFVQNIAQTVMMTAGVSTLVFGVHSVMAGDMSMGALVATMMLVWRVLSPIQTLFNIASRVERMWQGVVQLQNMMNLEPEQIPGDAPDASISFRGKLEFNRVSMRYTSDTNPALLGVSFIVQPGQMLGVAGNSGSGKTTLAKLILGMYRPQGGVVTLDDIDIRQLRPITLRQTIAYVPQRNHVFPGTTLDNIRLSDPTASITRVRAACRMAGVLHTIEALPKGFDTEFKEGLHTKVPQRFLGKIALARAFLRDAPIVILDEPAGSMDEIDEAVFLDTINLLRQNNKTIVMITQRPSHMRICDKLLVLDEGQVKLLGPPDRVIEEMFRKKPLPQTLAAGNAHG